VGVREIAGLHRQQRRVAGHEEPDPCRYPHRADLHGPGRLEPGPVHAGNPQDVTGGTTDPMVTDTPGSRAATTFPVRDRLLHIPTAPGSMEPPTGTSRTPAGVPSGAKVPT